MTQLVLSPSHFNHDHSSEYSTCHRSKVPTSAMTESLGCVVPSYPTDSTVTRYGAYWVEGSAGKQPFAANNTVKKTEGANLSSLLRALNQLSDLHLYVMLSIWGLFYPHEILTLSFKN